MALVIAGERSGVGKTTVTLALLSFLSRHKQRVQSFKVGPDYIDPMFHQQVTGRPCRNLDPVLTSETYVRDCFTRHVQGVDFALIEGVMGLFDGASGKDDWASTAHVARLLELPVLLVLDGSRLSRSVAAIAHGYRSFDPRIQLAGVVLNRVGSDRHLELLKDALEPLQIPVLGVLRRQDNITIPARHLGLVPTAEMAQLDDLIDRLAHLAESCFDWGRLFPLLTSPTDLDPPQPPLKRGENLVKVPLIKGDLGGSPGLSTDPKQYFPTSPSDSDPPQPPLKRGENLFKVPLIKGDLGGSAGLSTHPKLYFQTSPLDSDPPQPPTPLTPLIKGGTRFKVPLIKGDLGGSAGLSTHPSALAPPAPLEKKASSLLLSPFRGEREGWGEPELQSPPELGDLGDSPVRLAIARDRAFSFYYQDNLDILQELGAELVPWSPLTDTALPANVQGLYFGGGFPEVFAQELAESTCARESVRSAILTGMPTYAECGGLMYLCEQIKDFEGKSWSMVGVLPTTTVMGKRLTVGYRQATALQESPLLSAGARVWGHEFHHSQLTAMPEKPLFEIRGYDQRGQGKAASEGWQVHQLHASYVHLHWGRRPEIPVQFLQ